MRFHKPVVNNGVLQHSLTFCGLKGKLSKSKFKDGCEVCWWIGPVHAVVVSDREYHITDIKYHNQLSEIFPLK